MNGILWNLCLDYIKRYAIKIETPNGFGTGFFVAKTQISDIPLVNIATSYHVIKHSHEWREPIRITHINSEKSVFLNPQNQESMYSVNFDESHDLAIIQFQHSLLDIDEEPIMLTPHKFIIYAGTEIGWCGFPNIASDKLCFFNGHISAVANNDGDYYVDGTVINGVSGGPVFIKPNGDTIVIGLVTGYIPNQQMGTSTPGLSIMRNVSPIVSAFYPEDKTATK